MKICFNENTGTSSDETKLPLRQGSLVECTFAERDYVAKGIVAEATTEHFVVNWVQDCPLATFAYDKPIKWEWGWLEGDEHGDNPSSRIRKVKY